jgi:hypothetical protein
MVRLSMIWLTAATWPSTMPVRVKGHHRAHLGGKAARIVALGLFPPGMRIALIWMPDTMRA